MSAAGDGETFPWQRAMQIGLGHLKLTPKAFWSMTLKELAAAASAFLGPDIPPPQRQTLEELIARYPDKGPHHGTD